MFNFTDMLNNYEDRKVDMFEKDDLCIDTCLVTDGDLNYETAIAHKNYNGGELIIVEAYPDEESAQEGHNKWVKIMTADKLPEVLKDCLNSTISKLNKEIGNETIFEGK